MNKKKQARQVMKVIRKLPPEFKSAGEEEIWDLIEWIKDFQGRRDIADDVSDDGATDQVFFINISPPGMMRRHAT